MTILQAVAAGLENTEKRKEPKKKADRYFLDGKVADRELKVCNLCKIVWQRHVSVSYTHLTLPTIYSV